MVGLESKSITGAKWPDGVPMGVESGESEAIATHLGRYRLHRELAAGGMASVYLASVDAQGGFSKLVALKRIHDALSNDPQFVEMFLDEARLAARIEHPNVCTVFDFGRAEQGHFIAMEYLMGETFGAVMREVHGRPWLPEWPYRAAYLIAQAAEGLHAAHELRADDGSPAGVVHRDVSPQNLFITYSGVVKVVDFGIARAEGRSHHTAPGMIKGKFAYVAPEYLSGQGVDRRADVWSLGVTLWEMLTLRPLFRRKNTAETLAAVLGARIPRPSEIQPRVPPMLDDVVMRALARDPNDRYATARDLGRALVTVCREQVELFDAVDIEEWMQTLFPDEIAHKEAIGLVARETSAIRRVSAPMLPPLDPSSPSPGSRPPTVAVDRDEAPFRATSVHSPRSRLAWVVGAFVAAVIVGALGAFLGAQVGDRTSAIEASAPFAHSEEGDVASALLIGSS